LNEAIAFGSVEPFDCSLLFHNATPFASAQKIEISPPLIPDWRKGCCFAGQIALFRKMAAVPEGLPWQATPATGSFGEVQLLHKNINPNASGGMSAGS
jgi:hypothetical protein